MMKIDAIPIGSRPPEDINVIIEVPSGGEPIKYELNKALVDDVRRQVSSYTDALARKLRLRFPHTEITRDQIEHLRPSENWTVLVKTGQQNQIEFKMDGMMQAIQGREDRDRYHLSEERLKKVLGIGRS